MFWKPVWTGTRLKGNAFECFFFFFLNISSVVLYYFLTCWAGHVNAALQKPSANSGAAGVELPNEVTVLNCLYMGFTPSLVRVADCRTQLHHPAKWQVTRAFALVAVLDFWCPSDVTSIRRLQKSLLFGLSIHAYAAALSKTTLTTTDTVWLDTPSELDTEHSQRLGEETTPSSVIVAPSQHRNGRIGQNWWWTLRSIPLRILWKYYLFLF